MNFSIVETMRRLYAPQHKLSCSASLWRKLLDGLRQRGHYGRHESGAFLLGERREGRSRITRFVLYDDLDPKCLETGIVHFDGRYFGALWEVCRQRGLSVVADVHTHPEGSQQSSSDRANPMISQSGHIALIVPRFAMKPVIRSQIGIYYYEGSKKWSPVPAEDRLTFLHIGL